MAVLPGFWHAAARMTGRLDLSPLLSAGVAPPRLPHLREAELVALGLRPDRAAALLDAPPLLDGGDFVTLSDPDYPALLRPLPFAPPVLFFRGSRALLTEPSIAIVGSRAATDLGMRFARMLSSGLHRAGQVVISGLAHGIDTAAHEASMPRTVAVLGQAVDLRLPHVQERVADHILDAGGLILSELLPGTGASRVTFPQRNRIIAGMSRAVVVVEARERSGALITAKQALEFGRELLVVPGHPLMENAAGCLALLRHGAPMATSLADVLDHLGLPPEPPKPAGPVDPLLAAIRPGITFDALQAAVSLDAVALMRALSAHELAGRVERLPGDRFALRA